MISRLDEIRAREQAATKGPWKVDEGEVVFVRDGLLEFVGFKEPEADATHDFIAHAREDIPYLLDLVERAKLMIERWEAFAIDAHLFKNAVNAREWLRDIEGEG